MVEIECLVCGKNLEIPSFIDTECYAGQLVCQECGSLLQVKLVASKLQGYRVVEKNFKHLAKLFKELKGGNP